MNMPRNVGIGVPLILLRFLSLHHGLAEERPEATLPVAPYCGTPLSDRLIGGLQTQIDEFPWTVLIEYRKPSGQTGFHCGGSLINFRYVLTAAHCVNAIPDGGEVSGVRLGEWNLTADHGCEHDRCIDAPIDMGIKKIITHEDYDSSSTLHYNDIALIRLNSTVERSDTISPVCLPVEQSQRSQDLMGEKGYVAGWGKTENGTRSDVKLMIPMKIRDTGCCAFVNDLDLADSQICATGFKNPENDCRSTATGGSPLTIETYLNDYHASFNYQYGISSFGPISCGSKKIPEIYTYVSEYIDWIQNKMEQE